MNMTFAQLRAIEAVAETGSFSAAAKRLGVSQPTVSNHVTAVEKRFGVLMFERRGYRAHVTRDLAAILPKIRSILVLTAELEDGLSQQKTLERGQLRVGYTTYQIAIPILSDFMRRYPLIKLEARAMATHDLLTSLEAGQLDLVFITARELPPGLGGHKIRDLKLVLAVPEGHEFATRSSVAMRDLVGLPLIQRETSSTTRRIFDAQAAIAKLEMNTQLAVGSWGSIVELVRDGIGLGVALDAEAEDVPGIVPVPISGPVLSAAQFIAYLPERQVISTVQAFLELAQTADDRALA